MRNEHVKMSSAACASCQGCMFRFTDENMGEGCKALTDVPETRCSFYKTHQEQRKSLEKARARQIKLYGQVLVGPSPRGIMTRGY